VARRYQSKEKDRLSDIKSSKRFAGERPLAIATISSMWFLMANFVEILPTSSVQKDWVDMWLPLTHIDKPCDAHEMLEAGRKSAA